MDEEKKTDDGAQDASDTNHVGSLEEKLQVLLESDQTDFSAWTSLVTEVEKNDPNDMQRICLVYDSFLSEFPLCYGYWKKYAGHKLRLCTFKEVEEVYERAVQAAAYAVDLWVSYCAFGELSYENPADVRRLYERAFSYVGKDYLCYLLWDRYIKFEHSQKQWNELARIYINTLRFPTKKLHNYYDRFKNLVTIWVEETICHDDSGIPSDTVPSSETTDIKACGYAEISNVIKGLLDQQDGRCRLNSVKKYISAGELLYEKSSQLYRKISSFESRIRRPYFHVKPLDDCQLANWHQYLDFVEMQGDFDWAVKLYERCLVSCANYSEFWIRYVEFSEAKGGREIANHAITRALAVFLKKVPAFHIYSAMFKEQVGDFVGARSTCRGCSVNLSPVSIEDVNREANREKRMGQIGSAYRIYENAIEMAKEKQNTNIISALYANFAQFTLVVSGSIDDAQEVFIKGIQQTPGKLMIEGLLHFVTMHGGEGQIAKLDSIVASAISPESDISRALSSRDREDISKLFIEFVDLYGTIHEIRKAWDRHRRLFPHIMRPTVTSSASATCKNAHLEKSVNGKNGICTTSSCFASGINSHDGVDMPVMDNPPLKNNVATTENIPLVNSMQEMSGLLVSSDLDACSDKRNNGADMHVMDFSSQENNADIVQKHVMDYSSQENDVVIVQNHEMDSSLQENNADIVQKHVMDYSSQENNVDQENNVVIVQNHEMDSSSRENNADIVQKHVMDYSSQENNVDIVQNQEMDSSSQENNADIVQKHVMDNSSQENNVDIVQNHEMDNSSQEINGDIVQKHVMDYSSQEINADIVQEHVMDYSSQEMNADIVQGHVMDYSSHEECKNVMEGTKELKQVSEVVQKQSTPKRTELYVEDNEVLESRDVGKTSQASYCAETENPIDQPPDQESDAGLRPPALENLSINSPDNESREFNRMDSPRGIAQEVISSSDGNKNVLKDGGRTSEVLDDTSSSAHVRSGSPQENLQKDNNNSLCPYGDKTPPRTPTNLQTQVHVPEESKFQHALPVGDQYPQSYTGVGSCAQKYSCEQAPEDSSLRSHSYVQPSQTQQWQVPTDQQFIPTTTNSQMPVSQGYLSQPHIWNQQANQNQGQYVMAAAVQGYPSGSVAWPEQNIQQQALIYAQPQSSTQPTSHLQSQVYQQTLQSNGQSGYVQSSQGVQPHIWHYYQQLYYLQQQQNHQIQSQPQQQWQVEHLQQLQQKLAQQQQSQNQQLPNPNQQQQQISPQQEQNQQHHQQSQFQQWNQQVDPTQQHILYLQQQQQQQIYLQQQQQLYMQQQQQVQVLQQQLLQQQQQQQLIQQQQQLLQQHQQQEQHLQQQSSTLEPKAIDNNIYLQQTVLMQQRSVSQYGESYGEQVTSQGVREGLQNTEQSSSSQPNTPQKTPPN